MAGPNPVSRGFESLPGYVMTGRPAQRAVVHADEPNDGPPMALSAPLRNLYRAVLEDALRSALTPRKTADAAYRRREAQAQEEAVAWVRDETAIHPFSFTVVCTALGFEPAYVRRGFERALQELVEPATSAHRSYA